MYKINELASIASISTRTLRHYDEIGLLVPTRNKESGYRLYTEKDVNTLQTILFYKELGYELTNIKKIILDKDFDVLHSLSEMKTKIEDKIESLYNVLDLIEKTTLHKKGAYHMSNKDKFEAFKEKSLQENQEKYGTELAQKYDKEFVKKANKKYKNKTEQEMATHNEFTEKMHSVMKEAVLSNDPSNDISQQMCKMHKEWLLFYWPSYNKIAHYSLVEMYTQEERFTKHYEDIHKGLAQYLLEAMKYYIKKED